MRCADRIIAVLALSILLQLVLLLLLPADGRLVEAIYAQAVYPVLGSIVAFAPARLPFSLALVLLTALAIWVPAYLAVLIVRWRRRRLGGRAVIERALLGYLAVGALLFHSFYLFWGYNYFRPPLEARLGIEPTAVADAARERYARRFIEAAVAARLQIPDWDLAELDLLIDQALADAIRLLENRDTPVVSPLKGDLGTGLLALFGNWGFVSGNTLEAHVDTGLPAFQLPFTAAHEKAHLAGFARERDANFVAWLALTRAADPRLRYAGYFGVAGYFLNAGTRALAAPLLEDRHVLTNYSAARVSPPVQQAGRRVYGSYLRANRMPGGIGDYAEVSGLIVAWELQRR
jgi:hypothetical protein